MKICMHTMISVFLTCTRKALVVKLVNVLVEPQNVLHCKGSVSRLNAVQVTQRQPRMYQGSKLLKGKLGILLKQVAQLAALPASVPGSQNIWHFGIVKGDQWLKTRIQQLGQELVITRYHGFLRLAGEACWEKLEP